MYCSYKFTRCLGQNSTRMGLARCLGQNGRSLGRLPARSVIIMTTALSGTEQLGQLLALSGQSGKA